MSDAQHKAPFVLLRLPVPLAGSLPWLGYRSARLTGLARAKRRILFASMDDHAASLFQYCEAKPPTYVLSVSHR